MNSFIKSFITFTYVWVNVLFPSAQAGYSFHIGFTNPTLDYLNDFTFDTPSINKNAFNEDSTLYLNIYNHLDRNHKPKLLKSHTLSRSQTLLNEKIDLQERNELSEPSLLKNHLTYQLNSQGDITLALPSHFNEPITLLTPFSGHIHYAGRDMQEIGPSQGVPSYLDFSAHSNEIVSLQFLKRDHEITLFEATALEKLRIVSPIPLFIKGEIATSQFYLKAPSLKNQGIATWEQARFDMAELVNKTGGVLEGKKTTFSRLQERSEEGESSNAAVPPETSSKILHLKNLTNEGEIYWNKVNSLSLENLENKGIIHAKAPLKLTAGDFNNKGGSLGSAVHTFLKVTKSFSNSEGTIGTAGTTEFHWKGQQEAPLPSLKGSLSKGRILGDKTFISMEGQFSLPLQGDIVGKTHVLFNNVGSAAYPDLAFHAPLLELTGRFPALNPQTQCDLIRYKLPATGDVSLEKFSTSGRLELWQAGYDSKEQARQELEAREEKLEEENGVQPLISIKSPLRADKGISLYAPDFKVHLKSKNEKSSPDPLIFLPNSKLEAFVRSFDLEDGAVVVQDAHVIAPNGIRIGRLIEDPTRDVFSAFYNNDFPYLSREMKKRERLIQSVFMRSCRNLVSMRKLHLRILNTNYDIDADKWINNPARLPILPVFVSNNSIFLIKNDGYFMGPLQHQGFLRSQSLTLKNNEHSTGQAPWYHCRLKSSTSCACPLSSSP